MSRLFILLFSVIALTGFTACAQAQDTKPNAEVVFTEDGKPDLAAMLAAMKAKEDDSARQVEQEKAETEALQTLVEIAEKPTEDFDIDAWVAESDDMKKESAEQLRQEKAETEEATRRAEEATRRADIIEDFLEIVEKPTD